MDKKEEGDKTLDHLKEETQQECPQTIVEVAKEFEVYAIWSPCALRK